MSRALPVPASGCPVGTLRVEACAALGTNVRGVGPESVEYVGSAAPLREVWIALRANLRAVLEHVSIADVARDDLPAEIAELARDPDAWQPH